VDEASYRERLWVPLRWWALAAGFVASLFVAFAAAVPVVVAVTAAVVIGGLTAGWLAGYGSVQVAVGPAGFAAGRALLTWSACGDVSELDAERFRALRGPDADARAYLLLRPYIERAVRVDVRDPLDPTPYWLIATRHPERLAATARTARARSGAAES
jgi:hypothetical protein